MTYWYKMPVEYTSLDISDYADLGIIEFVAQGNDTLVSSVAPLNKKTKEKLKLEPVEYLSESNKIKSSVVTEALSEITTPLDFLDTCNHTNEKLLSYETLNSDEVMLILNEIISPESFSKKNELVRNVLLDYERFDVKLDSNALYVKMPVNNKDLIYAPSFVFPINGVLDAVDFFSSFDFFKQAAIDRYNFTYFMNENQLLYTLEDCFEIYGKKGYAFSYEEAEEMFESIYLDLDKEDHFNIVVSENVKVKIEFSPLIGIESFFDCHKISSIQVELN